MRKVFSNKEYMNIIPRQEWWGYVNWTDQCDVYLMICAKSLVVPTLKCYLGSILGSPWKLSSEGGISGQTIDFCKGKCQDKIEFHWNGFQLVLGEESLDLPSEIRFWGLKRILTRYLFRQEFLCYRIVMEYHDKFVVTNMGDNQGSTLLVDSATQVDNPIYTQIGSRGAGPSGISRLRSAGQ